MKTTISHTFWASMAVIFILVLQLPAGVFAQGGSGRITGTITDSSGAEIPGAEVTITNTETGRSVQALTNDHGRPLDLDGHWRNTNRKRRGEAGWYEWIKAGARLIEAESHDASRSQGH